MPAPNAIILLTGSELTTGDIHDLNGPFLSSHLTRAGIAVDEIRLIPDATGLMHQAVAEAIERADLVLVSGGLGPTADDQTVAVVADVFGRPVVRDPEAERAMRDRAVERGRVLADIPENFYKQAEVVEGSKVILNPVGLAPGFLVTTPRGMLVTMPGVPRELRGMFLELVLPEVCDRLTLTAPRLFRAKVMGHGESWLEDRIQNLGIDMSRVDYGISAKPGEIQLRFTAHAEANHAYIDEVRQRLEDELGDDLIVLPAPTDDDDGVDIAAIAHRLLLEQKMTVATAESCTGGLIAKHLTDHSGSSAYFKGAVVAYEDAVKERLLDVPTDLLAEHGAVSAEVCRAMVTSARRRFGTDFALATTGIAGPGGGSDEKPVGLVFIGIAGPGDDDVDVEEHRFWGDREGVRTHTTVRALDLLRRRLSGR